MLHAPRRGPGRHRGVARHERTVARHHRPLNVLAAGCALTGMVVGGQAIVSVHHQPRAVSAATEQQPLASAAPRPTQARADRAAPPVRPRPVRLHRPDLVVVLPHSAAPRAVARMRRSPGVKAVAVLARGSISLAGRRLTVLGADPFAIRGLTPSLTARSDALWEVVARGDLTMSFALAQRWRHRLGATLTVRAPQGNLPLRLGALASLGLGDADGLVNAAGARALGLQSGRELVISARAVAIDRLRARVRRLFGAHATMRSLRPEPIDQTTLLSAYARATIPASYLSLYRAAAATCTGLPWTVLAAIGAVETGHGANTEVSSKGAMGPMQFLPSTFAAYAVDGNRDGVADIRNPADAVYTAARYLCYAGAGLGGQSLYDAVWAYNHADWYVRKVLNLAVAYS